MAAAGERDTETAVGSLGEPSEEDGAEGRLPPAVLVVRRGGEIVQDDDRVGGVDRRGAQGIPGERGDGRGGLATPVAEEQGPRVVGQPGSPCPRGEPRDGVCGRLGGAGLGQWPVADRVISRLPGRWAFMKSPTSGGAIASPAHWAISVGRDLGQVGAVVGQERHSRERSGDGRFVSGRSCPAVSRPAPDGPGCP